MVGGVGFILESHELELSGNSGLGNSAPDCGGIVDDYDIAKNCLGVDEDYING